MRAFLRTFGIEDEHVTKELMRRIGRMAPTASPAQVDRAAGLWFAAVFGWPETMADKALAAGRVAWLTARAARRWPLALFADAPSPALAETLRHGLPELPPAILRDAMPAADLTRRSAPRLAGALLRARPA